MRQIRAFLGDPACRKMGETKMKSKKLTGISFLIVSAFAIAALFFGMPASIRTHALASVHTWQHSAGQQLTNQTTALVDDNYYLDGDVTLTSGLIVSGTVELCLNGHTLTLNGEPINVGQAASLTLHDCADGGKITGGTNSAIRVSYGSFIMEGGEISGNSADYYGGGVYVEGGPFTMNGGKISNNTVNVLDYGTNPTYGGGGVFLGTNSTMTMSGTAEISGNETVGQIDSYGGGIFAKGGQFTMDGGTISGNTGGSGGGVSSIGGTVRLTNGNITGNTASDEGKNLGDDGGGVYLRGGTFEMTGGTISGNKCVPVGNDGSGDGIYFETEGSYTIAGGTVGGGNNEGIGICVDRAELSMSGGTVSAYSTGVDMSMGGKLTMSNSAAITGCGGGVTLGPGCFFEMSGGTLSSNEAGVGQSGYYGMGSSNSICTVTGGTVSDNGRGIDSQNIDVVLGGSPVFTGNGDGKSVCDIFYYNAKITLLPSLSNVRIAIGIDPENIPYDGILTSGYFEGAEELFYFGDESSDMRVCPVETQVYDSDTEDLKTVTELALAYHFTLMVEGEEVGLVSRDYVIGTYINDILYEYDDSQHLVVRTDLAPFLVKEPDRDYHYAFSRFVNGQGEAYDCEQNGYELAGNTVVYAEFAAADHVWGSWEPNGETHIHHCDTCQYAADAPWGAWVDRQDGQTHMRTCPDGCGATQTEQHQWSAWTDSGDGEHHYRTCTDECGATQSAPHQWGVWYKTEGETLTRDCDDCTAQERKADERRVVAALAEEDGYRSFERLQSAFDSAEPGQTVYLVYDPEGIELQETLVIAKNVLLGAVVRTIGEDLQASYAVCGETVLLKRADGFDGTMIVIAKDAEIRFENLDIEGETSASFTVECLGTLTVAGGTVGGVIRVCASEAQSTALFSLGTNAVLSVTGSPVLGTIRLDDPSGGVTPAVDFEGFTGSAIVEISDSRPYGAFAVNIGEGANVAVQGGADSQSGLSRREVRVENGMALCGGYDLTVEQNALGEITLRGTCDEYLSALEVFVNGQTYRLSAMGGAFTALTCDTGSENLANISVGGSGVSFGLVYYDEDTGLLTAPEGATYLTGSGTYALDGADPLEIGLNGDEATVTVGGQERRLDLSRPAGTSFVHRYLTDNGELISAVNYTNYERLRESEQIYDGLTTRQKEVVNEKLAETELGSFEELLHALDVYLAEQNQKVDDFWEQNETVAKDFDQVTGEDREALSGAMDDYLAADEEERHFLDEAAKEDGYSGFEGMVEDLIAKSEFEAEREETLENLGTILRGCDGEEVQREFSLTIETVEGAVYERCTDDDLRLDYLSGRKEALATAVRVLENIRIEERVKSAFDAYLTEKQESGRYSEEALEKLARIAADSKSALSAIDPESLDGGAAAEEVFAEGLRRLNDVRALSVVSGEGKPSDVMSGDYPERIDRLLGYATKEGGFRGDSALTLLFRPADGAVQGDRVALFGVTVKLTGDEMDGTVAVRLLLPESARNYTGYRVMALSSDGALREAQREGDALLFDTDGMTEFVIYAQRTVDLGWLIVLLGCLCGLETAALLYLAIYFFKNRAAALAPVLLAVAIVPASAEIICAALAAVCLLEGVAIGVLLALIRKRESAQNG